MIKALGTPYFLLSLFVAGCAAKKEGQVSRELSFNESYSAAYTPSHRPNATHVHTRIIQLSSADIAGGDYDSIELFARNYPRPKDGGFLHLLFVEPNFQVNRNIAADSIIKLATPSVVAVAAVQDRRFSFSPFTVSMDALVQAMDMENLSLLAYILEKGKNLQLNTAPDYRHSTLLQTIATHDWDPFAARVTHMLLTAGADPNAGMPLMRAMANGNVETGRVLLKFGANPYIPYHPSNESNVDLWSEILKVQTQLEKNGICDCTQIDERCGSAQALAVAVQGGSLEEVNRILSVIKPDLNAPPPCSERNFLQMAITGNKIDIVRALLKAGANPKSGAALHLAVNFRNFEMVKAILESGDSPAAAPILQAIADAGDTIMLRYMFKNYPREMAGQACEAMHVAISQGNLSFLKVLMDAGRLLPVPCGKCMTPPLHVWADGSTDPAMFRFLLANGVTVNAVDSCEKSTALHVALHLQEGELPDEKLAAIQLLLQHGADVSLPDAVGNTPRDLGLMSDERKIRDLFSKKD